MYVLGQACGVVGTVITLLQPQFRRKEHILICTMLNNAMNGLNFLLIGQTGSAVFLCLVAIVQSMISMRHERQKTVVSYSETILFFLLYVGFGFYGMISTEGFVWAINMQNLIELLPIVGALMLMLSVFAKSEQRTRVFLLLNGASWAVYSAIIGATAFFSATASMISAAIALWKYRVARVSEVSNS